jgi:hypothetical protein
MAHSVLVMGESGTGKSTSIRNLNPKETFIINVLDKPLPFKNFKKNYSRLSKQNVQGNYCTTDQTGNILKMIEAIDLRRPEINTIIIDDFQYVMANEFMRKAKDKGYDKFVDIGQQAWRIILRCNDARPDLNIFILSHTETDALGRSKCKTIGKMLDDKITLEGMFTIVFHTLIVDNQYKFLTQNDGVHIAKSPMGMFDSALIDNDLLYVKQKIQEYMGDDEPADNNNPVSLPQTTNQNLPTNAPQKIDDQNKQILNNLLAKHKKTISESKDVKTLIDVYERGYKEIRTLKNSKEILIQLYSTFKNQERILNTPITPLPINNSVSQTQLSIQN